jgi:hypothetical protein
MTRATACREQHRVRCAPALAIAILRMRTAR